MKSTERHKLKENELARSVDAAREMVSSRQTDIVRVLVIAVVLIALVGGFTWWRQAQYARASAALAAGLAVFEAPVIAPTAPAPGSPVPVQQPGTFQTEQAKLEAALPKLMAAADQYPSQPSGIAARYYAASALASLGRFGEAEQRYQEVVEKAGSSLIYSRTARLGLADAQAAQGKFDPAIETYRALSTDTKSNLPIDGVLMSLGRTYARAGRHEEAHRAFSRIVDEFPQSPYAADARQARDEARKS